MSKFAETVKTERTDFLWRARFSSQATGYRYVYANSSSGSIYSKFWAHC